LQIFFHHAGRIVSAQRDIGMTPCVTRVIASVVFRRVSRWAVLLAYSIAALALAAQWTAAKVGLGAVPPLELSTVRFAIASALLVGMALISRTPLPLHRWRPVTAAAALGFLGFNSLAFLGLHLTPASDSALIVPTTIPVAAALFATLIREQLTAQKLVGFAVASVGAAIVIAGGQQIGAEISTTRLLGDLLELASAVCWAACLTVSALVVRTESVLGFVTMASLLGTGMLFPLGFLENGYRDVATWSGQSWLAAAILGVLSTVVAFLIFFWAVQRFGPSRGALISYLVPVAALLIAFVVLGERPLPLQVVGAAVILAGVRLVTRAAPSSVASPRPSPA
jgi:drug/metabolite transporter (DMT)-like permease